MRARARTALVNTPKHDACAPDATPPRVVRGRSLYVTVITTIRGYGDFLWVDVVEKVDEWGEAVLGFQAQCRKLPKALRDWPAYEDCRGAIDSFLEMLPLFQALAHKAMRPRHWAGLQAATGARAEVAARAARAACGGCAHACAQCCARSCSLSPRRQGAGAGG